MEISYELMLITKVGISEKEEKQVFDKIGKLVEEKGKINKTSNLGKKQFSYTIKKESEGNYWLVDMELNQKEVAQFSSKLNMMDTVLRFLILRKELKPVSAKVTAGPPAGRAGKKEEASSEKVKKVSRKRSK